MMSRTRSYTHKQLCEMSEEQWAALFINVWETSKSQREVAKRMKMALADVRLVANHLDIHGRPGRPV